MKEPGAMRRLSDLVGAFVTGKFSRMCLVEFVVELIHFRSCLFEGPLSRGSDFIEPAPAALNSIKRRPEQAGPLQAVQEGIKRTRADAIPVMFQFFHHRETKDGLVHCVQQYMDANQAVEEFPFLIGHENKYTSAQLP
jgi:hypothetical protein